MKTSVIGYPRIGSFRELKFASEKYFKKLISAEELEKTAADLRRKHILTQQQNSVDFIPSNDFSYYDNMLDTAFLLNIIPARYRKLGLSPLDTYFAMARGYQESSGNVKALAMKKWFNTNYHYIVPEIDDDTEIKLTGSKPFDEFSEAKRYDITTVPVLIGPFTFLTLSRYTGKKKASDFVPAITEAYGKIFSKLCSLGADWVQLSEPGIVKDLDKEDISLFASLYKELLKYKKNLKILLQTYFGDIRDCYNEIISLDFDGIGLDFIEGKKNLSLIKENGFPKDKLLFAGAVNGKNIWKNNYAKTVSLVEELQKYTKNIVLSTSCSLIHLPYTLKNETKLSAEYTKYFSFTEEKLAELKDLKTILSSADPFENSLLKNNSALFSEKRNCTVAKVQDRTAAIKDSDFIRLPAFEEREKIQKEALKLPLFPTTTIGSFPQTPEVRKNRLEYRKGSITEDEYKTFNKNKIAECIALQEEIGLDVLVHGEFERNDMVEYFGENLNGFLFTENAWVQSYGTRCVKPPIIWGDVFRDKPITVEWSAYARSLTNKPVKGMLTGPVTILNWSFPREDVSLKDCAYQIALAIRDEVLDLEANGIKIIQIDEAALREKLPLRKSDWQSAYLDWAIPAFRLVHSGVKAETQIHTHMCYSEFSDIISAIDDMDADVITFEASRSDLQILKALKENNFKTEVGPGVYDIHSPRIPSVDEITSSLRKMLDTISPSKLWVNPDCGLKTRDNSETKPSLENLVKAAVIMRKEY